MATPPAERGALPDEDPRRPEGARRRDRQDHRRRGRHAAQARHPHPGRLADPHLRHLRQDGGRTSSSRAGRTPRSSCASRSASSAAITPWNYPLHQIAAKVAPALAAGCTVVLKPSEVAPLNAFILAEVIDAAGLPQRRVQPGHRLRPGGGRGAGARTRRSTWSRSPARRARASASRSSPRRRVKRVALELGGKSASIVLDDADLAAAVKGTVNACFLNSGQTCSAHTRLLVPESTLRRGGEARGRGGASVHRRRSVGGSAKLGPLISAAQRERVRDYIQQGHRRGRGAPARRAARRRRGSTRATTSSRPCSAASIRNPTIAQEEIFGPVLSIITYKDEDDAIRIANDTIYGLGGGVWSSNEHARARRAPAAHRPGRHQRRAVQRHGAVRRLQAVRPRPRARRAGLEEYLEYKAMQIKSDPAA